jgi:hypothetical protein
VSGRCHQSESNLNNQLVCMSTQRVEFCTALGDSAYLVEGVAREWVRGRLESKKIGGLQISPYQTMRSQLRDRTCVTRAPNRNQWPYRHRHLKFASCVYSLNTVASTTFTSTTQTRSCLPIRIPPTWSLEAERSATRLHILWVCSRWMVAKLRKSRRPNKSESLTHHPKSDVL